MIANVELPPVNYTKQSEFLWSPAVRACASLRQAAATVGARLFVFAFSPVLCVRPLFVFAFLGLLCLSVASDRTAPCSSHAQLFLGRRRAWRSRSQRVLQIRTAEESSNVNAGRTKMSTQIARPKPSLMGQTSLSGTDLSVV